MTMSLLPRIPLSQGRRKSPVEDLEGTTSNNRGHRTRRRPRQIPETDKERVALPSIHGDHTMCTNTSAAMTTRTRGRPNPTTTPPVPRREKTATLKTSTVLHTPPANRRGLPGAIIAQNRTAPLETCHFCAREFGSASIDSHEKHCAKKLLRKHALVSDVASQAQSVDKVRNVQVNGAGKSTKMERHAAVPPLLPAGAKHEWPGYRSWEAHGSVCRYCGGNYNQSSIALHEKNCSDRTQQSSISHTTPRVRTHQVSSRQLSRSSIRPRQAADSHPSTMNELIILPRPQTRTLSRSLLVEEGHKIPTVQELTDVEQESVLCEKCGCSVPTDRASVHRRTCSTKPGSGMTKRAITFPSQVKVMVSDGRLGDAEPAGTSPRKPPTVICYICGREYGTKSISIHEPQCLKKWHTENNKLPISERKPLPKKHTVSKAPAILRVTSREETVVVGLPRSACSPKNLENFVESYYLQCYQEFERELQQCSTCGRKFAPDRMAKHAGKCKAKPLKQPPTS